MTNKKRYCKFVKQSKAKQSKAKQSKAKRELYLLINNSLKTFLIVLLSFILSFSISCSNEDTTGSGDGNSGDSGNGGSQTDGGGSGSSTSGNGSYGVTGSGVAADLEGRWYSPWNFGITNGLLTLPSTPPYSGQISNSFNYPFTIVLTSKYGSETGTAVLTFYNSTNAAYYYQSAQTGNSGGVIWTIRTGSSSKF